MRNDDDMNVSEEDMLKYHECWDRVLSDECKCKECDGCEFDLPIGKINI